MSKVETSWVANFVDNVTPKVEVVEKAGKEAASAVEGITTAAKEVADEVTRASTEASRGLDHIGESADSVSKNVKKISAVDFKMAADAVRDLTNQFSESMQPGKNFEVSMKDVQSITRQSNEEMEAMGKSARELAKQFGGDAAAQVESFGSIIARFGPEVAKDTESMQSMGNSVATMAKLMKGDTVGAMDALTTAMLQYGVNVNNAKEASQAMIYMMNVMAAAGNEGASEVSDTSEALKNVGIVAKQAGLTFEETNAALQGLAQGGRKGAEAGVSLRNVLTRMEGLDIIPRRAREKIEALGVNFDIVADKTKPFLTRLRELEKIQKDATLASEMFGVENVAAAKVLFQTVDFQEKVKTAITGTTAAYDSAAIVMDSQSEKMARMDAWINDLKISFFNIAGSMTPFIVGLGTIAFTIANTAAAITGISQLIGFVKTLTVATQMQTAAQWALNIAQSLSPTTWIIAGIVALVAIIVVAWNKFEGFRKVVLGTWEVLKGFGNIIKEFVIDRIKGMLSGLGSIGEAIAKLFKGDFSGGWEAAKKGVYNLSGIGAAKTAFGSMTGTNWSGLYNQGAAKGISPKDATKDTTVQSPLGAFQQTGAVNAGHITPKKKGKSQKDGVQLDGSGGGSGGNGGSGSGGGKTIVMTVNNYINGFRGTDELAQEVARKINGRLSDGLASIG